MVRAIAADGGLWGNHGYEAFYAWAFVDGDGQQLNGANNYVMHFDAMPPARAFWSVTMYDTAALLPGREPHRALFDWRPHPRSGHRGRRIGRSLSPARRTHRCESQSQLAANPGRAISARWCASTYRNLRSWTEPTNCPRSRRLARDPARGPPHPRAGHSVPALRPLGIGGVFTCERTTQNCHSERT